MVEDIPEEGDKFEQFMELMLTALSNKNKPKSEESHVTPSNLANVENVTPQIVSEAFVSTQLSRIDSIQSESDRLNCLIELVRAKKKLEQ
jgi:hypothetical protein